MEDLIIYKTKPGYFSLIFMLLGVGFMAFLCRMTLNSPRSYRRISDDAGLMIVILIALFFAGMSICCLIFVIGLRIFQLTNENLIIKRPLLLFRRSIPLADIVNVTEKAENIAISRGFKTFNIYEGKRATITLIDSKQIKISSIGVWGYTDLIKKTKTAIRLQRERN